MQQYPHPTSAVRESGQAAVFAVILLVAVAIGIGVLYNTGRLTLTKTHLQNAADSTAYSGGVLIARSYNFSSYANRAMVANQVVIAQMVGLRSWSQYYCLAFNDQCGYGKNAVYSVNDLPGQIQSLVDGTPEQVFFDTYKIFSNTIYLLNAGNGGRISPDVLFATTANQINKALSAASETFHDGVLADLGAADAGSGLLVDVLHDNDRQAHITTFGKALLTTDLAQVADFTQLYGSQNPQHMQSFAALVQAEEDGFTKGRSSSETLPYPMYNIEAFFPDSELPWARLWVSYHGHTTWGANYDSWSAGDSANIYGYRIVWITIFDIPIPLFLPILTDPSIYTWTTTLSSAQASYNKQGTGTDFAKHYYAGLLPYEDVDNSHLTQTATPTLTLEVARSHGTIQTTQQIGVDSGTQQNQFLPGIALPSHEAHNELDSLASVQVHFVRPQFQQGSRLLGNDIEYGSLFNPYWEAHLVPTPNATTLAAQVAQAGG